MIHHARLAEPSGRKQQDVVALDLSPQVSDEILPTVQFVGLRHVSHDVPDLHGGHPHTKVTRMSFLPVDYSDNVVTFNPSSRKALHSKVLRFLARRGERDIADNRPISGK